MQFTKNITHWFSTSKRDLPWRNTSDPYKIWLSEIILQQTQIVQGKKYYEKFLYTFPTIRHLAKAGENEVLALWQGLGYYSRARNLHQTAKVVVNHYNGCFPKEYDELLMLKGIGQYTAGAISSIAFNQPKAAVDGNAFRVLSRYFMVNTPIDSTKGKKEFLTLAQSLLDKKNPGTFNQALMELGALLCRPRKMQCTSCPVVEGCAAYSKGVQHKFPVKSKNIVIKNRFFNYYILQLGNKILLRKRKQSDIWANMYDFPIWEHDAICTKSQMIADKFPTDLLNQDIKDKSFKKILAVKHQLTHQTLHIVFYYFQAENSLSVNLNKKNYELADMAKLEKYAFPVPIKRATDLIQQINER